ncbi:hypothetical protein BKA70DRAFT_1372405 [Coprinopsis sp. MPI-PUGE-AT-0042]|nr:hypothetical protein BKA70DRAFT_1372405 [Coprinopsis sp. MPI-PUGE-AT-0042]
MSRPTLSQNGNAAFKVAVPKGWFTTVTAVSRRSYNQLVTVYWDSNGEKQSLFLESGWNKINVLMEDTVQFMDTRPAINLDFNVYHSTSARPSGEDLEGSAYKSNRINVVTAQNAPKGFPDYVTYIVMVEDSSAVAAAGSPEFDDVVITINIMDGVAANSGGQNPSIPPHNLPNIQGDILRWSTSTTSASPTLAIFRKAMKEVVIPKITTADELVNRAPPPVNPRDPKSFEYPFLGVNVGFSPHRDELFGKLGDAGTLRGSFWTPNWDGPFKEDIHGVFLIKFIQEMEAAFKYTANRSAIHSRTIHFGYRGGMSNPQVTGVTYKEKMRYPGAPIIPMGTIVMGYDGDETRTTPVKRPDWSKDGAFMVTRKLNNLPADKAALKLGARLFGRWKNGTSVEMSPDWDDPSIANDDNRINNFTFDQAAGQREVSVRLPHAQVKPAQRRSTCRVHVPALHRRHNMPYGPEVTAEERDGNGTILERGLHVVCYQSSIVRGFKFIQEGWYNDPNFPPGKPITPGLDPIFGQTGKEHEGNHRSMSGANPSIEQEIMSFPKKFIDCRGGEYFFSPSLSTLRKYIGAQ